MGGTEDKKFNLVRFNPTGNDDDGTNDDVGKIMEVEGWSEAVNDVACVYVSKLNRIYIIGGGELNGEVSRYRDQILYVELNVEEANADPSKGLSPLYHVVAAIVIIVIGSVCAVYRRKRQQKQSRAQASNESLYHLRYILNGEDGVKSVGAGGLSALEIHEFEQGTPNPQYQFIGTPYVCRDNINYQPYDRRYELEGGRVRIDQLRTLGSGAFGVVLLGADTISGESVAVKTTKPRSNNKMHLKALLSELKILIYLGQHPHIVNLIGARTTELSKDLLFLFVEFCPFGDLEQYLRNRKDAFVNCKQCSVRGVSSPTTTTTGGAVNYLNPHDLDSITACDLLLWSMQIASAMEFVVRKKVIHGDLAVRNILLLNKQHAKITDFGLAKKLYNYTNYYKEAYDTPLPWRSLAIESLVEGTFSAQSDVWSFGVTLWEIFSLGDIPFSTGTHFSMDFVTQLQEGVRLQKPEHASYALYKFMLWCWNLHPSDRPTFTRAHAFLRRMAQRCSSTTIT